MMKNDELIAAINEDFNYLAHYGLPGQEWYKNKAERYQNHAVYARGKPRYARSNSKPEESLYQDYYDKLIPMKSARTVDDVISRSPLDKKTGLHNKTKSYTTDEDIQMINPKFNSMDEGYKSNCVYCSVAYDMRKRGYEVTANKAPLIGVPDIDLSRLYPDLSSKIKSNFSEYGRARLYKKLNTDLLSQGEGARGILFCTYKDGWGGHAVVYEVDKGKVNVNDCQCGERYNTLQKFTPNFSHIMSFRLDNLTFDPSAIKEAVH